MGYFPVWARISVLLYDQLVRCRTLSLSANEAHLARRSRIGEWNLDQVRQKTLIPHPGRRILFIDTLHHDPSVTESVEQLGLEITVVDSMEEACLLDQAQSGYFDTVLVDQLSIVERLRDVEHLRYIPLVLITPQIPQLNLKVRPSLSRVKRQADLPPSVLPRLRHRQLRRIADERSRHVQCPPSRTGSEQPDTVGAWWRCIVQGASSGGQ